MEPSRLFELINLEGVSGKFLSKVKQTHSSKESYDGPETERLLHVSSELTGLKTDQ
ncbi:MAG TPA: hypothetical protein VEC08_04270 [Nitrososphaerales archaeon]|nr:hypothetical protein [Nitrososphaerales archaeon]